MRKIYDIAKLILILSVLSLMISSYILLSFYTYAHLGMVVSFIVWMILVFFHHFIFIPILVKIFKE